MQHDPAAARRYIWIATGIALAVLAAWSLNALHVLSGVVLFWIVSCAVGLSMCLWWRWSDRGRLRWINRLTIDERGIAYAEWETNAGSNAQNIAWSEISRVIFYFGEPDFPDPMVGMAPVRHWEIYSDTSRSLYVPDLDEHSDRLIAGCSRQLTDFDAIAAKAAVRGSAEGRWILWQRSTG